MKLHELSEFQREQLYFASWPLLDSIPRELLGDVPTEQQLLAMRIRKGIVIGPNQEVLRIDQEGKLRECKNGIPCAYYCVGVADGQCTQRPCPPCNIPEGTCKLSEEPCHSYCRTGAVGSSATL